VQLFSSFFNVFFSEQLYFTLRNNAAFWGAIAGIFITGAIASGMYPAFFLSSSIASPQFNGSRNGFYLLGPKANK
jgi:hypothetical protein